jgi:hypothetical protein
MSWEIGFQPGRYFQKLTIGVLEIGFPGPFSEQREEKGSFSKTEREKLFSAPTSLFDP